MADRNGESGELAASVGALVTVSRTRWRMLELAAKRPCTVSEMARTLGIGKSAVHEHAQCLRAAGLLNRRSTDRKWVYYETAPRGRACLEDLRDLLPEASL